MSNKIIFLFSLFFLCCGVLHSNDSEVLISEQQAPMQLSADEKLKIAVYQFKTFYQENRGLSRDAFYLKGRPRFFRILYIISKIIEKDEGSKKECLSIMLRNLEEAEREVLFACLVRASQEKQAYFAEATQKFGILKDHDSRFVLTTKKIRGSRMSLIMRDLSFCGLAWLGWTIIFG